MLRYNILNIMVATIYKMSCEPGIVLGICIMFKTLFKQPYKVSVGRSFPQETHFSFSGDDIISSEACV